MTGCIGMLLERKMRLCFRVWRCMWSMIVSDSVGCLGMRLEVRMRFQGLE